MEEKVTNIDEYRPHLVGQVICVNCSYIAISVLPLDANKYDLECPRCKEIKMAFIGLSNAEA